MIKKIIVFATIILLVFSCKESDIEDVNKYQIISLLFEKLAKPIELVYGPNFSGEPLTRKDSVHQDSLFESIRKERAKYQFIIAVYPYFTDDIYAKHPSFKECPQYYNKLMDDADYLKKYQFRQEKGEVRVDFNKLENTRNDSIIIFKKDLLKKYSKEYDKFNILISFSDVIFNDDYTMAAIKVHHSYSKLGGESTLFLLEKINNKWLIKCGKVTGIS